MDVSLIYPDYSDILQHNRYITPEYFYHCNINGRQVIIRKIRNQYCVQILAWLPPRCSTIDGIPKKWTTFNKYTDLELAVDCFTSLVRSLTGYIY